MNQALQDVIEHRRTTNVFKPMRAARGLFRLGRASRALSGCGLHVARVLLVAIGRAATGNWPQKSRRPLTEVLSFA